MIIYTIKNKKMELKDLRIGNLVYHNQRDKHNVLNRTNVIHEVNQKTFQVSYNYFNCRFTPIEIKHEALLSLGFDFIKDEYYVFPNYDYQFYWNALKNGIIIELKGSRICAKSPIKYIHELQNIFQDLTGKELTIKD